MEYLGESLMVAILAIGLVFCLLPKGKKNPPPEEAERRE